MDPNITLDCGATSMRALMYGFHFSRVTFTYLLDEQVWSNFAAYVSFTRLLLEFDLRICWWFDTALYFIAPTNSRSGRSDTSLISLEAFLYLE